VELAEFETDVHRVFDEVVEGRVDIPWLRAQIDRLAAARERLEPVGRMRADWFLVRLRDHLAADEADRAWAATGRGEHPVVRAIQIRANAGYGGDESDRIARLRAGGAEIEGIARSVDDPAVARVVRQEGWLVQQQITALHAGGGDSRG